MGTFRPGPLARAPAVPVPPPRPAHRGNSFVDLTHSIHKVTAACTSVHRCPDIGGCDGGTDEPASLSSTGRLADRVRDTARRPRSHLSLTTRHRLPLALGPQPPPTGRAFSCAPRRGLRSVAPASHHPRFKFDGNARSACTKGQQHRNSSPIMHCCRQQSPVHPPMWVS